MSESTELEKRIIVLETNMDWSAGKMKKIEDDLEFLKTNQIELGQRMEDRFTGVYAEMASMRRDFSSELSGLRSELHGSQAGVNGQIGGLYHEMGGLHHDITGLHQEITGLHQEISGIHGRFSDVHEKIADVQYSITVQTRWILAAAGFITVVMPVVQKMLG